MKRSEWFAVAIAGCVGVEVALGIIAFLLQPPSPRIGQCVAGSRGSVCLVRRVHEELLGANVITVPTAEAIPQIVTSSDQVWLKAQGLPQGWPVALALTAPDGTQCTVPEEKIEVTPDGVQAFIIPASCADSEGVWSATFDASGIKATTRFRAVRPS